MAFQPATKRQPKCIDYYRTHISRLKEQLINSSWLRSCDCCSTNQQSEVVYMLEAERPGASRVFVRLPAVSKPDPTVDLILHALQTCGNINVITSSGSASDEQATSK